MRLMALPESLGPAKASTFDKKDKNSTKKSCFLWRIR